MVLLFIERANNYRMKISGAFYQIDLLKVMEYLILLFKGQSFLK